MDSWVFMDGVEEKVPFEIMLLAHLNHPNIIRYIDHFIEEKYVILITELHGTEWNPRNPILNSIRNPGLKKISASSEHESKVFKGIPKKTSCDLFECIGKKNIYF
jgi:serine/threonine protein kinase